MNVAAATEFKQMKTQSKDMYNQMEDKYAEFAKLQKRSRDLSDLTVLAEASNSL